MTSEILKIDRAPSAELFLYKTGKDSKGALASSGAQEPQQRETSGSRRVLTSSAPVLPSPESADNDDHIVELTGASFNDLLKMMQIVQELMLTLSSAQTVTSKFQEVFSEKLKENFKATNDELQKKIAEMNKKIHEQKKLGLFAKIGMDILGALMVIAAFVFMGPGAGAFALAMFAMQASGGMDKMTDAALGDKKNDPAARAGFEFGIAVGAAVVGGSISALIDGLMTNLATTVASQSSKEVTEVSVGQAAKSFLAANGTNLALQALAGTNFIADFSQVLASVGGKKPAWLQQVLTVLISMVLMLAAAKGGSMVAARSEGALTMKNALPEAAKNSAFWSGYKTALDKLQNTVMIHLLTVLFTGATSGFKIGSGVVELEKSKIYKDQGPLQANIQQNQQLSQTNTQMIAQIKEQFQNLMELAGENIARFQQITQPAQAYVEAIRGM